jgi:hypothetical protein
MDSLTDDEPLHFDGYVYVEVDPSTNRRTRAKHPMSAKHRGKEKRSRKRHPRNNVVSKTCEKEEEDDWDPKRDDDSDEDDPWMHDFSFGCYDVYSFDCYDCCEAWSCCWCLCSRGFYTRRQKRNKD